MYWIPVSNFIQSVYCRRRFSIFLVVVYSLMYDEKTGKFIRNNGIYYVIYDIVCFFYYFICNSVKNNRRELKLSPSTYINTF